VLADAGSIPAASTNNQKSPALPAGLFCCEIQSKPNKHKAFDNSRWFAIVRELSSVFQLVTLTSARI